MAFVIVASIDTVVPSENFVDWSGSGVESVSEALTFATRELAEAHIERLTRLLHFPEVLGYRVEKVE